MASIRLGRYEVRNYELPAVCARCGAKAVVAPSRTFSWNPPWLLALFLLGGLGLVLLLVLAAVLTKRMSVPLPLCERHRHYWRNRAIGLYGGLAALIALAVAAIAVGAALDQRGWDDAFGFICIGGAVVFFVWLIVMAVVQSRGIRATEITDNAIALTGLSKDFTEAVRQDRRGDEDDEDEDDRRVRRRREDYDERPPRARRRVAEADDGGYYDAEARRRVRKDRGEEDR